MKYITMEEKRGIYIKRGGGFAKSKNGIENNLKRKIYFPTFFTNLHSAWWNIATASLQRSKNRPPNKISEYDTKLHLMVRLHS